jgi:hypothetical protein
MGISFFLLEACYFPFFFLGRACATPGVLGTVVVVVTGGFFFGGTTPGFLGALGFLGFAGLYGEFSFQGVPAGTSQLGTYGFIGVPFDGR